MSLLLMEGDIRSPEVWVRGHIHDRRAAPIGVRDLLPSPGTALAARGESPSFQGST